MAAGIIAIEVIYTIPLLVLINLNGDTEIVINEDNPPFTNVSQRDPNSSLSLAIYSLTNV